jgi:hypothetical protein
MKNKNIRNTKYEIRNTVHDGTALLMTVLILNSILLISLATAQLIINGVKNSGTQSRSTQAYFAAETGSERMLFEYRKGMNNCGIFGYATTTCVYSGALTLPSGGNSTYSVRWVKGDNNPGDTLVFISIGTFAGLGRSDELDFGY